MYAEGDGVDQNYKKAKEWWERAARQGIAEASGNLANLYENGDGVKRNRKKARKWQEKALAQGLSGVQTSDGDL